ncbi:hypothetical protein [Paraburkholderia sp. SIMBA_030]|uniref:hypothetical protein n=1 Tax=Paraburkholderia sp. SIMBA_030 TaxID=3085773 RepID=UPI003978AFE0
MPYSAPVADSRSTGAAARCTSPGCAKSRVGALSARSWGVAAIHGLLAGLSIWAVLMPVAFALDIVKPLKSEEFLVRYAYPFELLTQVLNRTIAAYGPYAEQPYTDTISVARSHMEALKGERINVMISDAGHREFDEDMIPIPFPIDKGLLGYRVALIAADNQPKIDAVRTLDQFRTLSIGQGSDWGDVRVYEYNHVPVRTAETYDSLFLMLLHRRFDLFPRGVTEAPQELRAYGARYPNLAIDRHLLIRYPFAQFFYVSKSEPRLAARIRDGLEQMERDGSFDTFFNLHFSQQLSALKLKERTLIELQNPFLPAWVPLSRKELWFDPASLR